MRKGHWVALTVLLGISVIGLVSGYLWSQERKYEGKPLTQWVNEQFKALNNSDLRQRENEEKRFASLGSALGPNLISVLEMRSGLGIEDRLAQHLLQVSATRRIARWLDQRVNEAQNQRMEASFLLGAMGPLAEPVIPAMIRIYQTTNQPDWVRGSVLDSLRQINRRPDLVVPVCVGSLSNVDRFTPQAAAWTLGAFGTNSIAAIPALRQALQHPNVVVALLAAQAIHRIDHRAWLDAANQVTPILVRTLGNKNKVNRLLAISLLAQYEARAEGAVPLLIKLREEGDPSLSGAIAEALKKIDPEADVKPGVK
jgi:HEAT repeat protein